MKKKKKNIVIVRIEYIASSGELCDIFVGKFNDPQCQAKALIEGKFGTAEEYINKVLLESQIRYAEYKFVYLNDIHTIEFS